MKRTNYSLLLIMVVIGTLVSSRAWSQDFKPSKQIETVVHTGAGGGSDLFARAIAEMMQKEKLITAAHAGRQ